MQVAGLLMPEEQLAISNQQTYSPQRAQRTQREIIPNAFAAFASVP
jgi:hypothetical protein